MFITTTTTKQNMKRIPFSALLLIFPAIFVMFFFGRNKKLYHLTRLLFYLWFHSHSFSSIRFSVWFSSLSYIFSLFFLLQCSYLLSAYLCFGQLDFCQQQQHRKHFMFNLHYVFGCLIRNICNTITNGTAIKPKKQKNKK